MKYLYQRRGQQVTCLSYWEVAMFKVVYATNSNVAAIDQVFEDDFDAMIAWCELAQADADEFYDGDFALAASYYAMVEC